MYDAGQPKPELCDKLEGWGGERGRKGASGWGDTCVPMTDSY